MNTPKIFLSFLISIFGLLVFIGDANAQIISTDETWTASSTPYIINDLTVQSGATLTLKEGAVLKMSPYAHIDIYGTLNIEGTSSNKIYITSIKDDSIMGDTNGDGTATTPQKGDWQQLKIFSGGILNIDNAVISYGGYYQGYGCTVCLGSIANAGGNVNIQSSRILNSANYSIYQYSGNSNISFSDIEGDTTNGRAMYSRGGSLTVNNNNIQKSYVGVEVGGSAISLDLNNNSFSSNTYDAYVNGPIVFTHSNNTSSNSKKGGFYIDGSFAPNTILTKDNMPYILGFVKVDASDTLIVDKGSILKIDGYYGRMDVYGTLNMNGADTDKVYITSINDDSIGGDTNGDGNTTSPQAGDWNSISVFHGGALNIQYTELRYGGKEISCVSGINCKGSIFNYGGSVTAAHLNIINSKDNGIWQEVGSLDLSFLDISTDKNAIHAESGDMSINDSFIHDSFSAISAAKADSLTLNNNIFDSNYRDVLLDFDVSFTHSNNISQYSDLGGFIIGGPITKDTAWTKDSMPYIAGRLVVPSGFTFNIEKGAVVKFSNIYGRIENSGTLNVNGTDAENIHLTSLKDDSAGGDSNGDGIATSPAVKDWAGIQTFEGGVTSIDNAEISYGGYTQICSVYSQDTCAGVIFNKGETNISNSHIFNNYGYGVYQLAGDADISSSEIDHNNVGVRLFNGTASIAFNNIHDNLSYGIANTYTNPNTINAIQNYWGDPKGPYHPTKNPAGTGDRVTDNVDFEPWLKSPDLSAPTLSYSQE